MTSKTKGVLWFLGITFGLAWLCELGALLLGFSLTNLAVQLPVAFSPAIAAVIVRRWITGEGFRDAGNSLRLRSGWFYYLMAAILPMMGILVPVALVALLGLYRPDFTALRGLFFGVELPVWGVMLLLTGVCVLLAPVFWGEEFGWRSYLQLRLWSERPLLSAVVTGLIWGAWHYPLAFTGYSDNPNVALAILLNFTLANVLLAIVLAWLRLRSGSVWPACIAHAGNNLIVGTLADVPFVEGGKLDPSVVALLLLSPLAAICAWIVLGGQLKATKAVDVQPDATKSW